MITNLSEEEKKNGFVTTPFTEEQLKRLIKLDGVNVVDNENEIIGYVLAGGWDYFSQWAMFPFIIERFEKIIFKDIAITKQNSFQYGPICIDIKFRGTDVFPLLFEKMRESMSSKYQIGATFINKKNERSFHAHTLKVKIEVIDEFEYNNNSFYGLAFTTK